MSILKMKVDALMRLVTSEDGPTYDKAKAEVLRLMEQYPDDAAIASPADPMGAIEDALTELGMPNNIRGFDYAAEAIRLAVEDKELLKYITKGLLPAVAEIHGTTPSRVDRAIRHGIELCWTHCDTDVLDAWFGNTISPDKAKATTSQFIARVSSVIRRRMNGAS